MRKTYEEYLIEVGTLSCRFTYKEEELYGNMNYFKKCYKEHLSAYKALLYLDAHINYDEEDRQFIDIN